MNEIIKTDKWAKLEPSKNSFERAFGSCAGNGIISGNSCAIYKKFCDKIILHTNLYISPFYEKIVS